MSLAIDLNSDMGEGFGRWQMPADAELAHDGTTIPVHARTPCVHSDAPNAVQIAREVRAALAAHDIAIRALSVHPDRVLVTETH
jgi:lactam utilization protein B